MIISDIIYTSNSNEFGNIIFEKMINIISETIKNNGKCFMAVPGGNTPLSVYKIFAQKKNQKTLDWSKVYLFFIDERCVPKNDRENNFKSCFDNWLQYYPEIKFHRIKGWLNSEKAALQYQKIMLYIQ